jgi:hypothetical protein
MTQPTITLAGTIKKLIDRSIVKQPQLLHIGLNGADLCMTNSAFRTRSDGKQADPSK